MTTSAEELQIEITSGDPERIAAAFKLADQHAIKLDVKRHYELYQWILDNQALQYPIWRSYKGAVKRGIRRDKDIVIELAHVKTLALNSFVDEIPESIVLLSQLENLAIDNATELEKLPDALGELPSLQFLSLSKSTGITELPESLGNLKSLQVLNIQALRLKTVPVFLKRLESLHTLVLSANFGIDFPAWFGKMNHLKTLSLTHCNLESIPKVLQKMGSLKYLNFSNNPLKEFPDDLHALKSLQVLRLLSCSLTEIPRGITTLPALKVLRLSGNKIKSLSKDMISLQTLEELRIEANLFDAFPEVLYQLPNIHTLYLGSNPKKRIAKLPEDLGKMQNLHTFAFATSGLTTIPECLYDLPKLKFLLLNDGKINKLPVDLKRFQALEQIWLKGNPLSDKELYKVCQALPRTVLYDRNFPENFAKVRVKYLTALLDKLKDYLSKAYSIDDWLGLEDREEREAELVDAFWVLMHFPKAGNTLVMNNLDHYASFFPEKLADIGAAWAPLLAAGVHYASEDHELVVTVMLNHYDLLSPFWKEDVLALIRKRVAKLTKEMFDPEDEFFTKKVFPLLQKTSKGDETTEKFLEKYTLKLKEGDS